MREIYIKYILNNYKIYNLKMSKWAESKYEGE